MRLHLLAFVSLLLVVLTACGTTSTAPPEQKFVLRGEVLRIDESQRIATIRHQKIEGWMDAMTMDFPVRERENMANLRPGNTIQGTIFVQGLTFSIGDVQLLSAKP